MKALLCMTGWHGYSEHPVEIIGKTPRRYRIKSDVALKLPGRRLEPGKTALVPKHAIKTFPRER